MYINLSDPQKQLYIVRTISILILQMRKLKHRDVKWLAQVRITECAAEQYLSLAEALKSECLGWNTGPDSYLLACVTLGN